jgi:hypothetical protein
MVSIFIGHLSSFAGDKGSVTLAGKILCRYCQGDLDAGDSRDVRKHSKPLFLSDFA